MSSLPNSGWSIASSLWRYRLTQALDLLYPITCLGCGRTLGEVIRICRPCRAHLPSLGLNVCPLCARPDTDPQSPCGTCQQHPPQFTKIHVTWRYTEPLASWIRSYKYGNCPGLETTLADLTDTGLNGPLTRAQVDRVVAVPLHPQRLAQRGYDQADRLALRIARRHRLTHLRQALMRIRATASQMSLSKQCREKNVRGAFWATPKRIKGGRILLIDDVVTSGATVNAATKALLEAGAELVIVAALARA